MNDLAYYEMIWLLGRVLVSTKAPLIPPEIEEHFIKLLAISFTEIKIVCFHLGNDEN